MGDRTNNLDFLRFFAAFLVIYGHSYPLVGLPVPGFLGSSIAGFGVVIFFSISGYLIYESRERSSTFLTFAAKRCLRIFPALAVVVVLTAFVMGPLVTTLATDQYFAHPGPYEYLWNALLITRYFLPGVFADNPYPSAVNGSLWSLPVEFICYGFVAAVGFLLPRLRTFALVACLALTALGGYYLVFVHSGPRVVFDFIDLASSLTTAVYFFGGALLARLKSRLPLRLDIGFLLFGVLVCIELLGWSQSLLPAIWLIVPYVVLAIGFESTPVIRRWGRFGDFSYGMYLYAFPIQQLLAWAVPGIGVGVMIVSATIGAVGCGALSWHLVEKWAMRLKPRAGRSPASPPVPVTV